ncbi:MAG: serine/threonine protein kinase [Alphaproteobacteria bacterium]|nr:serine/threonine protein kinase [Alphaproteobacteria bacterium]
MHPPFTLQLLERLGAGAHGEVYRAHRVDAQGFTRVVAVKLLHAGLDPALAEELQRRLRDEARLLSLLRHPVFVTVEDLLIHEGRWAIVMEYVPGVDLSGLLKESPVPEAQALRIVAEVAEALERAWHTPGEAGQPLRLVHRDIKPGNIRVTRDGQVKLLDFGIARGEFESRETQTRVFSNLGSFGYMSPQQLRGQTGPEHDVYALGVVLGELMLGRYLHELRGLGREECLDPAHLEGIVHEILEALEERKISRDAARLVARCLRYAPEERPAASELARLARRCARRQSTEPLNRWARRRLAPHHPEVSSPVGCTGAQPRRLPGTVTVPVELDETEPTTSPSPTPKVAALMALALGLAVSIYTLMPTSLGSVEVASPTPLSLHLEGASPWPVAALLDGAPMQRDASNLYRIAEVEPGPHRVDLIVGEGCVEHMAGWCGLITELVEVDGSYAVELTMQRPVPPQRPLRVEAPGVGDAPATLWIDGASKGDPRELAGLTLAPGLYEAALEVGDCRRRCSTWSRPLEVWWATGEVVLRFPQARPPAGLPPERAPTPTTPAPAHHADLEGEDPPPDGPPPAVLVEALAAWLAEHPDWLPPSSTLKGLTGPNHLLGWIGAQPPPGTEQRAATQVSWSAANAFCVNRGGLAALTDEPREWTPDAQHPRFELRQANGAPALRYHNGDTKTIHARYAQAPAGFRCAEG